MAGIVQEKLITATRTLKKAMVSSFETLIAQVCVSELKA
jgi:hypothetical protein